MKNPNRIVSPARSAVVGHDQHGWTASEREIKQLLGLGKKLPVHAVPAQVIQGVKVWVNPAADKKITDFYGKPRYVKVSTHRVMCECPQCGWQGSVGRLAQHVCK